MKRRSFLIASGATLAGCATRPSLPVTASPESGKACCLRFSEANFIAYQPKSLLRLQVSEDSSSYAFKSGNSKFAGLRLEPRGSEDIVEITTTLDGIWLPLATVYIPALMFLGENFEELSVIEPTFYQNTGKLEDTSWSTYYAACFLPRNARFILIFSDESKLLNVEVPYVQGGGLGPDLMLTRIREVYKAIDPREYANGNVKPFQPERGFSIRKMKRQATGEVRIRIS